MYENKTILANALKELNLTEDSDFEKNINGIKEKVNNLEKENKKSKSNVKTLGVVAGLGWIGTFVSLGCIFQNELKNACDTVYKKVLELKNSILG